MKQDNYTNTQTTKFNRWMLFAGIAMLSLFATGVNAQVDVTASGGTLSASYTTLKGAFDAINAGTHTGTISIGISASTTETATAALSGSGTGSASYTTISIQPTGGAARTISGAITAGSPLIDLNGADNVTFDGLNSGGNSLTISNTTASSTSNTSTIRFLTDATNNTITNCTILGSSTAALGTLTGNIIFGSAAVSTGNDGNTVSNCDLGPAGANLPTKLITFTGSSNTDPGTANSGIVLNNNNFFDWFSATAANAAIDVNSGTVNLTISNNRFYQTASRTITTTTSVVHSGVRISNTSGFGYSITGNTFGYASKTQTGNYTIVFPTSTSDAVVPITLSVSTTASPLPASVQGNYIGAFTMTGSASGTSSSAPFRGIYVSGGVTSIGDVSGNTIGSMSATGNISFTSASSSAADIYGMYNFGSSNWVTNNNNVGGITAANSSTGAANIYGIRCNTGTTVTWTVQNNTVGGTVANSLSSTSTATGSLVNGITITNPIATCTGNIVRNLSAAGGTGTTTAASVIGINVAASSANHTVGQNQIYNLSNSNASAATVVTGIQYTASSGTNVVERNLIYGLSSATTSTAAEINGIRIAGGTTTYRNNMIALGAGVSNAIGTGVTGGISGILEALGTNNIWHNTIYIGGSPTAGVGPSFAFNGQQTVNTRSFRDNIFQNSRSNSGASGKNYIVRVGGTTANPSGLTINNNIYYGTGSGSTFGYFNSADVASLAAWKTAVGQDAASIPANPQLNDPTNSTPDLHLHATNPTPAEAGGFDVGVTNDYDGQTRASLTPTDIGADAGNFVAADVLPPTITFTALNFTCSTGDRTLSGVNITDATGVPTSGTLVPRIYYRKGAGSWFSQPGTLTSGTGTNGNWDFTIVAADMGGLSIGDGISYYVIAQDAASPINITSNPSTGLVATDVNTVTTPPSPSNSYSIANMLSGTYTVGSGGAYATITAAVAAYNSSCLSGPVVFSLTDALYAAETYPIQINANAYASSTNTLTIKPASGVSPSLTGTSASALFILAGADYVTIDGSNSASSSNTVCPRVTASRDMTITQTNTGTSSAVIWIGSNGADGATNNIIRNLNIVGQANTTTLFGIGMGGGTTISTTSLGAGNNNNTINNNNISATQYGIYTQGTSAASKNTGNTINLNLMNTASPNNVSKGGIWTGYENNLTISGNSISGISQAGSPDVFGISLGMGTSMSATTSAGNEVTNATVSKNIIGSVINSGTFSAAGIALAAATSGTTEISNNMIYGVAANGTSGDFGAGIILGGGTGSTTNVYYNTVSMQGTITGSTAASQTSACVAVTNSTAPVLDLRNNILSNTQQGNTSATLRFACIAMANSTYTNLTSNNNDLYSAGAGPGTYTVGITGTVVAGTNSVTLANWQSTTGKDGSSLNILPVFTSGTDMHILASNLTNLPLNDGAVSIGAVTNDIDCDTRATDIGADEFTPPNCTSAVAGTSSASPAGPFCGTASFTLNSSGSQNGQASRQWRVSTDNFVNDSTNLGTGTSQSVSLSTPGTYYYRYEVTCAGDGSQSWSSITTIVVNPVPTASISPAGPVTLCTPATQLLTASTNGSSPSYQWKQNGTNVGTNSATYTASSTGSYTVVVTDGGCPSTSSAVSVTINQTPSAVSISPSSPSICNGASQTLTASGGTVSGAYAFGTQQNQNSASTSSPGYPAPYTVYYGGQRMQMLILASELSAAGFSNGSQFTSVQFPVVSLGTNWGGALTSCNAFQVSIGNTALSSISSFQTGLTQVVSPANFTPVTGYSNSHSFSTPFTWNGTSNIILETTFSNNISGASGDEVIQYNTNTAYQSTIVYRADGVTAAAAAAATTVTFSYSARPDFTLNGSSLPSWSWSPNTATTASVSVSPTTTTAYTATATINGCSSSASATVTVNTTPTGVLSGGATVCLGTSTSLSIAVTGTGPWSGTLSDATAFSGSSSPITVSVNPSSTTSYSIATLTDAGTGCSATGGDLSGSATVTVNDNPTVTISGAGAVCPSSPLTLTANPSPAGTYTYAWTPGGETTVSVSAGSAGTYSVTVTDANGCTGSNSATVTTQTYDITASAGANGSISPVGVTTVNCEGSQAYTITPASCYQIADVLVDGVSVGTPSTYTFSNVTANHTIDVSFSLITYTISASAGANGSISPSGSVSVNCGDNQTFTFTADPGYSVDDVVVDAVSQGPSGSYTFTNVTANHSISVSFSAGVCSNPPTANAGSNDNVCGNASYILGGSIGGGATSAMWSTSGDGTFNGGGVFGTATTYTPGSADISGGTVTITLTTDDPDGAGPCLAATSSFTLTVYPSASASISGSLFYCTGGSTTLTASATPAAVSYLWSTTETTASISVNAAGTYSVTTTDANGCTANSSVTVANDAGPTASISGNATICGGTTETLTASATGGSGTITNYQWVLNGTTNVGTNSATYGATAAGSYTVIVTNSNGCTVTSAAHVLATTGPLSGTYTIGSGPASCTNYVSFASAIADLNTLGVAGNVIFDVPAGYTETAPGTGLILNQCSLAGGLKSSASQTITFQKSGAGANPKITAGTGTGTADGIVVIVGMDYVTFDAIDVSANPANVTNTTKAEYGYVLTACSGTDGAQYNTIKNCTVTLDKSDTLTIGMFIANNGITVTAASGSNSYNKFISNTVTNSFWGIYANGFADVLANNFAFYDQNNEIGQTGLGNTVTNFGHGSSVTSSAYGIVANFQNGVKVVANSVNNAGGSAHLVGMNGIRVSNSSHSSTDIIGNTITLSVPSGGTGQVIALYNTSGSRLGRPTSSSVNNVVNIKDNVIQNCSYSGSADMWLLYNSRAFSDTMSAYNVNITGNQLLNNTNASTGTTQTFYGIISQSLVDSASISNNTFTNNAMTGATAHGMRMIVTGYGGFGTGTVPYVYKLNVSGNTMSGNTTVATSGSMDNISLETYVGSSAQAGSKAYVNNNTVGNTTITAVATSAYNCITTSSTLSTNSSVEMSGNTVTNITRNSSTSGAFSGIRALGTALVGVVMDNNTVSNVSLKATTGAFDAITSASTSASSVSMTGNTVSGNTVGAAANTGVFNGVTSAGSTTLTTLTMNNNTVQNNTHFGSGTMACMNGGSAANYTISGNQVLNNTKTHTSTFTWYGMTFGGTTTSSATVSNNTISGNLHRTTTSTAYCLYSSASILSLNITNNTVQNNTRRAASGTFYNVYATGSTNTSVSFTGNTVNNNVSDSTSGTSSTSIYGYYNFGSPGVAETYTGNTITNLSITGSNTSTSNAIYGLYTNTTTTPNKTIASNNINNLSSGAAISTTIYGIYQATGATTNIYKNKIYGLSAGGSSGIIHGIYMSSGTTVNIYNNIIGDMNTPTSTSATSAANLTIAGGTTANVSYNTFRLPAATGSGAAFGTSNIYASSSTPTVTLRNNILINLSTPGGTAGTGGASVNYRRASLSTTYGSASNNNIFYAGTPDANHLIYGEGTTTISNGKQTVAALASYAGGTREANSQTENVSFLSTTGSNANFLHVNTATSTLAESGAANISGITDDFDGDVRQGNGGYAGTGTAPDIGADEFNGTSPAPVITNVVRTPSTIDCNTSAARTITADVSTPSGTISTVTLNYSVNGTPQTPVSMTLASGTTTSGSWSGVIPAVTPVSAVVTWNVVAVNSVPLSAAYVGASYQDAYLIGTGYSLPASANPASICLGNTTTLSGSVSQPVNAQIGTATTTTSTYPFYRLYGSSKTQMMYTATELSAAGLIAGNITAVGFNVTTAATDMPNYSVSMKNTSATTLSAFESGLTTVYTSADFIPVVGVNSHTLSTPFYWNGTSNVIVEVCFANNDAGNTSSSVAYSNPGFASVYKQYQDNSTTHCSSPGGTTSSSSTTRPNLYLTGNGSGTGFTYVWSSSTTGNGLNSTSGTTVTATPTASGSMTYSLVATDANGCSLTSSPVVVDVLPVPSAPIAHDSTQCGNGVPSCYVVGSSGATLNWYNAASGGTLLQSSTDTTYTTSINTTTTFYVAEVGTNGCIGDRVAVTQTVTQPDAIDAQSDLSAVCPGTQIELSVIQTGSTNTYDYTWTAVPASGSGISGTLIGSPVNATPTTPGTYKYVVTAVDGPNMCTIQDSVFVTVYNVPNITSVSASPSTVCATYPTTLTALTPVIASDTLRIGTGTTGFTGAANPYYRFDEGFKAEFLIKASDLSAAGLAAGNITEMSFIVTNSPGTPNNLNNYTIKIAHTAVTTLSTTFQTASYTTVFGPSTFTPVTGLNVHTLSTPFNWNGSSNILVSVCYDNDPTNSCSSGSPICYAATNNAVLYTASVGYNATHYYTADNTGISNRNMCDTTGTLGSTQANLPNFGFRGQKQTFGGGTINWVWNPGSLSGNQVTVNPTTTTNYTVTATDPATSCTNSATVLVTVNPTPPAPTASNGSHCGNQTPTCFVTRSQAGTTFRWYTQAVGGTAIAGQTDSILISYPRNQADVFYVSEVYPTGSCEGPRVMVSESHVAADVITATATVPNDTICPFGTVTLSATQGTTNTYTSYTWTSIPAGGTASGQNTTAAAPNAPGQVIWVVTATDGTCTTVAYDTIVVRTPPVISSVTSNIDSVCPGTSVVLTALTPTTGAGTVAVGTQTTTSISGSPLRGGAGTTVGNKVQYLFTAAELTAAGLYAGQITSLGFNVTTTATSYTSPNFTIRMGHTAVSTLTSTYEADPANIVLGPTSYASPASSGQLTIPITPFVWNGTSNVLIQICNDPISPIGTSLNVAMDAAGTGKMIYSNAAASCSTTTGTLASNRAVITFGGQTAAYGAGSVTWTWNPGSLSGNQVTVNPTTTTTYTVTAADPNPPFCYNQSTKTVVVRPEPAAPLNPVSTTQCGAGVPTSSVTRSGPATDTFKWYTVPTGGTAISGQTDSVFTATLDTSTTFYISEFNGYCEGPRATLTVTVNPGDSVLINASATSICLGQTITLDAIQQGSASSYVFTWSANPSGTAGLSGTSGLSVSATPTAIGNYTYTVTAYDAGASCTFITNQVVAVNTYPGEITATAVPSTVCAGSNVVLTGNTFGIAPGTVKVGSGTSTSNTFYGNPLSYLYENVHQQFLFTASELTASGLYPGNISSLGFKVTALATTPTYNWQAYTVKIAHTTTSALTTTFESPSFTTVFGPSTIPGASIVLGNNFIPLTTSFLWNGTSNIVIDVCWGNDPTGTCSSCYPGSANTPTVEYTTTTGVNTVTYVHADNTSQCGLTTGTNLTTRPNLIFGGQTFTNNTGSSAWVWNPGSLSGNSVTVNPTTTTTYTVTASNGVCSRDTTVLVTVNPLPATPVASNSTQCGYGTPSCSVSGGAGPFTWYTDSTGTAFLPGQSGTSLVSYPISETDTFYVSESNGTCESHRVMVIATVTPVDTVTATLSADTICLGSSVTLGTIVTGTNGNTYTFTWTANPSAGSGITGSLTGTGLSITPTDTGSYVYTVNGADGLCNSTPSTKTLRVGALPSVSVGADINVCTGSSATLTANSPSFIPTLRWTELMYQGWINNPTVYSGFTPPYITVPSGTTLDIFEITNLGTGPVDPVGIVFEQWTTSTTAPLRSVTVPSGAALVPSGGSMFLMANSSNPASDPANNVYRWGPDLDQGSGTSAGFIIKKNGVIIDAVATSGYTFPAASGVTVSDWSGNIASNSGLNGSLLISNDNNTSTCWANTSTTNKTSYGTLNPGVTASLPPSGSVVWSSIPPGFSGSSAQISTGPVTSTTTYVATLTNIYGCSSSDTVVVTPVTSPGVATITSNIDTICNSGSAILTASGLAQGATIQWQSSPSGLSGTWTDISGANALVYTTGTLASTTYFRLYASCSTADTSVVKAVVIPTPSITSLTGDSRCGVGQVTLTAAGNGNFRWFTSSSGGTALFTGAVYQPIISATTTYWVEAFIGNCLNTSGRQFVTANFTAAPTVSFVSSADTVCEGTSITLTASSANTGYTYYWSTNGTTVLFTGNPYVFTPSVSATYYLLAVDSSGGPNNFCGAIGTPKAIVVNPDPIVPVVTPATSTLCTAGDSVLLTVSNAPAISAGFAYSGTGTIQNAVTGTTNIPPYGNYYTGNRHQMLLRASDLQAMGVAAGPITSLAFDVVSNANTLSYNGFTIKMGHTAATALSTTFEPAPSTTVFTGAPFVPVAGWNTHNFTTSFTWNGVSNILVETYFSNCTGSATCSGVTCTGTGSGVTWFQSAATNQTTTSYVSHSYFYSDGSGCSPETQTTASTTASVLPNMKIGAQVGSAIQYTWNPGGQTGASVYVHPTATTTYTVTAAIGNCSHTGTAVVNYNPINLTITPSGPVTFCGSGTVSLDAGGPYDSYSWSPGGETTQVITVSPTSTTDYTVTVTSGVCTVSKTQTVTVYPNSPITITPSSTAPICGGAGNVVLTAASGYTGYMWTPGGETTQAITVSPASTTTYTVSAVDVNGCTQEGTYTVTSYPAPATPVITPTSPVDLCWDGSSTATFVTLTADTTGAGSGASLEWNDIFASTDNFIDVYAADYGYGTQSFTITVTNSFGCQATSTATVNIITCGAGVNLDLKLFLEGYYLGGGTMYSTLYDLEQGAILTGPYNPDATDTIQVNLWSASSLSNPDPDYSEKVILTSNGTTSVNFPTATAGYYYIAIRHKNTIETWSKDTVSLSSTAVLYDFSTALTQAYDDGFNAPMQSMGGGVYAFYSGDVNQDGTVDGADMNDVFNDNNLFLYDYLVTDCTGDGTADGQDMNIVYNNNNLFLFYARPY